jgi:hypothetical protein
VRRPEELQRILDEEEVSPTYADLSTITHKEWEESRRSGERPDSVGEGNAVAERVLTKDRANARKRNKTATAQLAEEPAKEDEWDSEANDYESSMSDTVVTELEEDDPPQDTPADERERYVDFDGPFAVVI